MNSELCFEFGKERVGLTCDRYLILYLSIWVLLESLLNLFLVNTCWVYW